MRHTFKLPIFFAFILYTITIPLSGCGIYSFNQPTQLEEGVKTVRIRFENRAPYVNPQLSPQLTERFRTKVINQTKLTNINSDQADYDILGTITDYSVATTGVTTANGQQQASIQRLTVGIQVTLNKTKLQKTENYSVSRSFEFGAGQTLQQAESQLLDQMVRNLSDEMFNQIFSKW
jgi:outer membrane lipopolysaccharide assembly protein LptE/RlpB